MEPIRSLTFETDDDLETITITVVRKVELDCVCAYQTETDLETCPDCKGRRW